MTVLRMDRSVPFVDVIFRIIEGTGTREAAAVILREAENAAQIEISTIPTGNSPEEIPEASYSELVEPRMRSFFSATHLALGSYEYSRLHVLLMQNYTYSWSHREWAHMVANWANSINWLGVSTWNYLDFYGGPNDQVIETYGQWSEVVMQVIAVKSELTRQGKI